MVRPLLESDLVAVTEVLAKVLWMAVREVLVDKGETIRVAVVTRGIVSDERVPGLF